MNDCDQALLDSLMYDGQGPGARVTAYWYSARRGLPCDLESLRELGLQAARRARWLGLQPLLVPEGPFLVHAWPERVWDQVTVLRKFAPPGPAGTVSW